MVVLSSGLNSPSPFHLLHTPTRPISRLMRPSSLGRSPNFPDGSVVLTFQVPVLSTPSLLHRLTAGCCEMPTLTLKWSRGFLWTLKSTFARQRKNAEFADDAVS